LPCTARKQGGIIATADWLPIGQSYVMLTRDNPCDGWHKKGEEWLGGVSELMMDLMYLLFKASA
jgi:hypothetical protein